MRLIIAGGREFDDYDLFEYSMKGIKPHTVLCGGCPTGADQMGEDWAVDNGIEIEYYRPEWSKYKNAAGPIRNRLMAQNASHLIAFWDGHSSGTKDMLYHAKQYNLKTKIVYYKKADTTGLF